MSKKQTTNTFGKGMILDLHPLTVPNDVLTDALNATTVTMNGNEGILQNDMGNGRVESAFLPPGYVPVGIKEYEGIIYVASYNPITNKSQIGSFPSPERNIDQSEEGQLENPLSLLDTYYKRNYKFNKFNTYGNGSLQIGLGGLTNKVEIFGDYKVLRSGDKFGFYFDEEEDSDPNDNNTDILSNFFQFEENPFNRKGTWDENNKIYQNNIVTLSTQVLDSNNNLRDLTKQLKRFDENNKIIKFYDTNTTDDDKFNAGYFIIKTTGDNWDKVAEERDKSALNTYNNKLFGRLYLVGNVNVIDHIDVQLVTKSYIDEALRDYMTLQDEEKVLYFYIDYYFNCPEENLYDPKIIIHYNNEFKTDYNIFPRPTSVPTLISTNSFYTYFVKDTNELINPEFIHDDGNGAYVIDDGGIIINEPLSPAHINQNVINGTEQNQKFEFTKENIVDEELEASYNGEQICFIKRNNIERTYEFDVDPITYDSLTNLYRKRYLGCIILNEEDYSIDGVDNTILNYIIIPQMKKLSGEQAGNNKGSYSDGTNIVSKLTHIAYEGSIDLSKIGSGECDIVIWHYICKEDSINLNWGLEDYPLDTDVITDMKMEFYDWNTMQNPITNNTSPVWSLSFNQISYNSINTQISFGDNTIKKRHIYLVKLSRKKNEITEIIGWRVLITTSIYNNLFMTYDDYCSAEALSAIKEKNIVKLDFNVSLESNTKSPSAYSSSETYQQKNIIIDSITVTRSGQEDLVKENVSYYYKVNEPTTPTGYTRVFKQIEDYKYYAFYKLSEGEIVVYDNLDPDPIDEYEQISCGNNIKLNIDKHTYGQVQYTSFNTTKKIKVNLDISDDYPFELDNKSSVNYTISPTTKIEGDMLYNMVNEGNLPNLGSKQQRICEFDTTQRYQGEPVITIKSEFNFPSVAIYKYSQTLTHIISRYTYISLYDYIMDELPDKIIFPYIGGNGGKASFDLLTYDISYDGDNSDFQKGIDRLSYKPIYDGKKTYINLFKDKEKIDDIFKAADLNSSTFVIVGSPITFGFNPATNIITVLNAIANDRNLENQSTSSEERYSEYDQNFDGNYMLRHYQYTYGKVPEDFTPGFSDSHVGDIKTYPISMGRWSNGRKWVPSNIVSDVENFPDSNNWGHKDWFVLLWKNKDNTFTMVNKFYAYDNKYIEEHGIENQLKFTEKNSYYSNQLVTYPNQTYYNSRTDIKDWIIGQIFGNLTENVFFKNDIPSFVDGYLVDVKNALYNTDYKVTVTDNIVIDNIKFSGGLLKYFESSKPVRQEEEVTESNNYNLLSIPFISSDDDTKKVLASYYINDNLNEEENAKVNQLKDYLEFKLESGQNTKLIDSNTYVVLGMDDFISNLDIKDQIEGFILIDDNIFIVDANGLSLIDNIYINEDGRLINSAHSVQYREFFNSLTVQNNKLLVSNYNLGKSTTYAFSSKEGQLAVRIGNDIPYIRFEPDNTINTSLIIGGDRKAYSANFAGSGSLNGSGSGEGGNSGGGSGNFGGAGGN